MATLGNLVAFTTTATTTADITVDTVIAGFLFPADAGITNGATVTYSIKDGVNSEVGRGVYSTTGPTITRATVLASTNAGAKISLSGTAQVRIAAAAEDFDTEVNAQTGTTYTVVNSDLRKLITLSNTSSIAVTLPQATGLFKAGWSTTIRNLNRGTVTITPTTSTINGAASLVLQQGQNVKLVSDGTNWLIETGFGVKPIMQVFTASGTYTPTTGMVYCQIECVGGGGGGGGTANAAAGTTATGGGGGGGQYSRIIVTAAAVGASQTVTVGAGGAASSAGDSSGGNGGNTSVGSLCSAGGGVGGAGCDGSNGNTTGGGAGGFAGTGTVTIIGETGGGRTVIGAVTSGGAGGSSVLGQGALPAPDAVAGLAGTVYGGGGSGGRVYASSGAKAGGAGAVGYVIITEYVIG